MEEVKKSIEQEQDMEIRVRTYARLKVVVRELERGVLVLCSVKKKRGSGGVRGDLRKLNGI